MKSFRFAGPAALLVAAALLNLALPAFAAKPGPGGDCDDTDSGVVAIEGTLAVTSSSQLSACSTKYELQGRVPADVQSVNKKHISNVKWCDISVTAISVDSTDDEGNTSTSYAVDGTVQLVSCDKGGCNGGTPMDALGVIAPDGTIQLTLSTKKGLNAVNVRQAFVASVLGRITFKAKEGATVAAKGSYVGHVTIVK